MEHKDDIYYYPDCETMTDVAYYYIDELQALGDIPPSLQNYIDYEAYGRDLDMGGCFIETSPRYVRDTILTLEDQRQALLLLTAYFSFKGQSETWLSFLFVEKELKELEKD